MFNTYFFYPRIYHLLDPIAHKEQENDQENMLNLIFQGIVLKSYPIV